MSIKIIRSHAQWLMTLRAPLFIFVLFGYFFLMKVIIATFIFIFSTPFESNIALDAGSILEKKGVKITLLETVILVPIVETIVCQWLPIRLMEFITKRWDVLIATSSVFFTLTHIFADPISLCVVLIAGIILAFSFLHWKHTSTWKAFVVTTVIHILSNGLSVGLALVDSG